MTYGLSTRLFVENGPAVEAEKARRRSSAAQYSLVWDRLGVNDRLALVEGALRKAA